ncbi:anaerobic ribonucleotide reductase-activating protein [compost metagenome]
MLEPSRAALAELCDVIIDGRYVAAERDVSLVYRGSRNQRMIDVRATQMNQKIVTLQMDAS